MVSLMFANHVKVLPKYGSLGQPFSRTPFCVHSIRKWRTNSLAKSPPVRKRKKKYVTSQNSILSFQQTFLYLKIQNWGCKTWRPWSLPKNPVWPMASLKTAGKSLIITFSFFLNKKKNTRLHCYSSLFALQRSKLLVPKQSKMMEICCDLSLGTHS